MRKHAVQLAEDIMVRRVITLRPEMDVFDACSQLVKHRISGAPVVNSDGIFLGVFSEGCCMSVLVDGSYGQLPTTRVDCYMQTDIETIHERTDLLTIAQIFKSFKARRLPVLRDGYLVGQVSRRDLLRAIHAELTQRSEQAHQLLYLSSLRAYEDAPL